MTLGVLLLCCPALAACGADGGAAAQEVGIQVETQDWNGWSEEPGPGPERESVTTTVGGTFTAPSISGDITFTVESADDDEVRLSVDQSLSPETDGGIDLRGATDELVLRSDTPLVVATPTMDAGTTITLTRD